MCTAGSDGCFLIRAYEQALKRHGPDRAMHTATNLYRRTNTAATQEEAVEFISRFIAPGDVRPDCVGCG